MSAIAQRVRELVAPLLTQPDTTLYDVEYHGATLRIVLGRPGGVDMGTITEVTRAVSAALDEADVVPGAYTLEVSSPGLERALRTPEHFAAAEPVLNAIGKTIVHVGPAGAGQTVKAANQLIVAVNIQALAEAVAFLEAFGVDTDAALKVLGGGLAGSKVLDQKGQKMLDRNFDPGFRLALHNKDLGIVTSAARSVGVTVPLGAAVAQLVNALVARGDGGLDHSGLFKLTTELSGRD